MDQYIIKGGNPLVGEVEIGGAKNAALPILAAAIMADEPVLIENLPNVNDINILIEAIGEIGAKVRRIDEHAVEIDASTVTETDIQFEIIKKIRASYYFLGAMLGKYGKARVALPGGCKIGSRPIDLHIKGFEAMNANVDLENNTIGVESKNLKAAHIFFDKVSVGATINVMMAAVLADGRTILENAAKEPHVVDLANFLASMGANIRGAGTDTIRITGVKKLHRTEYSVIPDQIEAGTYMYAAATTMGDITVKNVVPKHLEATTSKLLEIGCEVREYDDSVRVIAKERLKSTNVITLPYPGFPTDMQAQMGAILTLCKGKSMITENLYENRFTYLEEMERMGAKIKIDGMKAYIEGVEKLTGAQVSAPDLRAGAALVMAGLVADGITEVDNIVYIQRGYENFEEKITNLGGIIKRVSSEREKEMFKIKYS